MIVTIRPEIRLTTEAWQRNARSMPPPGIEYRHEIPDDPESAKTFFDALHSALKAAGFTATAWDQDGHEIRL